MAHLATCEEHWERTLSYPKTGTELVKLRLRKLAYATIVRVVSFDSTCQAAVGCGEATLADTLGARLAWIIIINVGRHSALHRRRPGGLQLGVLGEHLLDGLLLSLGKGWRQHEDQKANKDQCV